MDNQTNKKREVYIRVVFLKLGEIDTLKEKYAADVFFQARWREERFDNKDEIEEDDIVWDEYWSPKLSIENLLNSTLMDVWRLVEKDENGHAYITEKHRINGTFAESLELNEFPFDTQDLTIKVITERSEAEVQLCADKHEISSVNNQSFVDEQEWRLHSAVMTWNVVTAKVYKNRRHKHPALCSACKVTRRPEFFIWNILVVMMFICSLAFATFTVDYKLPQNRLQLTFILLLTTVTFKFVVNQSLPKISYLTYLDKYILTSMTILISICVWHAIVPKLGLDDEDSEEADKIALGVLGAIYLVFHIFFGFWISCASLKKRLNILKEDADYLAKINGKSPKKVAPSDEPNQDLA
ncbi:DgyrCDS12366 [Dimorphilus gyrociliatus]|uniref:DgyrCDS12366 n=1 Tax=Dimorphilus gyrociliatus TaxID=2664684 RepID=A0A7I8W7I9_9ANNE|nr:DgyrCDS12366 [Dimorphilus gyrociliatus]